jgi:hypothetical protein
VCDSGGCAGVGTTECSVRSEGEAHPSRASESVCSNSGLSRSDSLLVARWAGRSARERAGVVRVGTCEEGLSKESSTQRTPSHFFDSSLCPARIPSRLETPSLAYLCSLPSLSSLP